MHDTLLQGKTDPYHRDHRDHRLEDLPLLVLRSDGLVTATFRNSADCKTRGSARIAVFLHHRDTIDGIETSWLRAT